MYLMLGQAFTTLYDLVLANQVELFKHNISDLPDAIQDAREEEAKIKSVARAQLLHWMRNGVRLLMTYVLFPDSLPQMGLPHNRQALDKQMHFIGNSLVLDYSASILLQEQVKALLEHIFKDRPMPIDLFLNPKVAVQNTIGRHKRGVRGRMVDAAHTGFGLKGVRIS